MQDVAKEHAEFSTPAAAPPLAAAAAAAAAAVAAASGPHPTPTLRCLPSPVGAARTQVGCAGSERFDGMEVGISCLLALASVPCSVEPDKCDQLCVGRYRARHSSGMLWSALPSFATGALDGMGMSCRECGLDNHPNHIARSWIGALGRPTRAQLRQLRANAKLAGAGAGSVVTAPSAQCS
jgi:hypothetical protein